MTNVLCVELWAAGGVIDVAGVETELDNGEKAGIISSTSYPPK